MLRARTGVKLARGASTSGSATVVTAVNFLRSSNSDSSTSWLEPGKVLGGSEAVKDAGRLRKDARPNSSALGSPWCDQSVDGVWARWRERLQKKAAAAIAANSKPIKLYTRLESLRVFSSLSRRNLKSASFLANSALRVLASASKVRRRCFSWRFSTGRLFSSRQATAAASRFCGSFVGVSTKSLAGLSWTSRSSGVCGDSSFSLGLLLGASALVSTLGATSLGAATGSLISLATTGLGTGAGLGARTTGAGLGALRIGAGRGAATGAGVAATIGVSTLGGGAGRCAVTVAGMMVGTAAARVSTGKSVKKSYRCEAFWLQMERSTTPTTGSSTTAEERIRTTAS